MCFSVKKLQIMWLPVVIYVPALCANQGLTFLYKYILFAEYLFIDSYKLLLILRNLICIIFGYIAFSNFITVTGVNVHLITPIVCIVCIFYTCVGGMKAVVWVRKCPVMINKLTGLHYKLFLF